MRCCSSNTSTDRLGKSMDPVEKRKMLDDLERGSQALRDALRGIGEEQAAWRPGPDRWSVLDCVEHLAVVEEYLLGQLEATSHRPSAETNLGALAATL